MVDNDGPEGRSRPLLARANTAPPPAVQLAPVDKSATRRQSKRAEKRARMVAAPFRVGLALLLAAILLMFSIEKEFTFDLTPGTVYKQIQGGSSPVDAKVRHNMNLIRERPRNLRLVFLGDSVTRYQYLSLAYFLRHGRWFDHNITDHNNLVNAHSFHHSMHPDEDWNEFFWQSNRMLYPMEACDCLRSWDGNVLVERRYFFDKENNNMMVYINMNGNERNPGRGYYGRLNPASIFGPNFETLAGFPFGMNVDMLEAPNTTLSKAWKNWEYSTWGDLIRHHVGNLNLDYDANAKKAIRRSHKPQFEAHIILNAGLHPHDFGTDPLAEDDIRFALKDINLPGTWKTTTYSREQVLDYQQTGDAPEVRMSDINMCAVLGSCFDVSWTADMRPELYFDNLHFSEPLYRILNEEYLDQLGLLPQNYRKYNRTKVLQPPVD